MDFMHCRQIHDYIQFRTISDDFGRFHTVLEKNHPKFLIWGMVGMVDDGMGYEHLEN